MFQLPFTLTPAKAKVQPPRTRMAKFAPSQTAARTYIPALAGVVLAAAAPSRAQTSFPAYQPVLTWLEACGDDPNCEYDPPARRPDVVVAATRAEQDRREVGQAVTTITRADLDRRQTVSVADLLATTPGVSVTRNGSVGGFTGVRLRGAEAEQTLVVIDGIRVNDPSSPGGGFDFANLLASSVERIEVLRGPNSVPWGSQAIGGVVNVLTADPARLASGTVTVRAQAEYGTANQLYATTGIEGRTGIVSGGVTGGYLRTDGISSAASGTERDGYRQIGATGRLGLALTEHIGIDLRGYYADSHLRYDGFANAVPFGPADGPQSGETQELYGYAGAHANLLDGRFRNRVAFTIADVNRDNFDPDFPSFARGRSERYEYQGDLRATDAIRLVGGAERENSRFNDGATFADTGITSVYGQAIVKPVQPLTLTGGVRYDDHDTFGGHTTFGGDAALALDTGTTLRASYGEGFKAPTLFQLYSFFGNGRLDPETARSFDLGAQQSLLDGRATIGATYFNRRTRNQIDFRSCTKAEQALTGSICVGRPFGVYDNVARTRAEGVELELALRPVDALTLTANVTYVNAKNRSPGPNDGLDLARRPHETASVDADYRFPFGLRVGGTVLIVGDSFDDVGNRTRLDGYALASVRASLPVGERLELYGRIENIADEHYQTAAGYGTFGRAAYGGVRVKLD